MTVEFGLALVEKHLATPRLNQWMEELDALLPLFEGRFKSLWMTDHLFWDEQYTYEAWTVMTWLLAKWPRFDVGPMVIGQNYRNPALLAKMAATLQVFSGGRFIMGIGAGWKEDEYRGYGYELPPPRVRLEQLEDTIEIMKRLWTQKGSVNFQGTHYAIHDAVLEPKPAPPPTLVVGVNGDRAMRIAARHADWWNVSDASLARYTDRVQLLDRYCDEIGRDPKSIRRTWFGRLVTGRTQAEVKALAQSRAGTIYTTEKAFVGTPAQVIEQLESFVAVGADYFMIDIVGWPNTDVLEIVLNEIVPALQGKG